MRPHGCASYSLVISSDSLIISTVFWILQSLLNPFFFRSFSVLFLDLRPEGAVCLFFFQLAARGSSFSVLFFIWRREGALILRIPKYALHILYLFHMIP